ncbi:MAG: DUF2101 family protein [Candidatus Hadarchaeales archaeon]
MRKFFRKVGEAVLYPRLPRLRPRKKTKKEEIPGFLKDFFEKRHAGWPEYVMLKLQLSLILLFLFSVLYLLLSHIPLLFFMIFLTLYLLHLSLTQLKRVFREDYPAYLSFTLLVLSFAWLLLLLRLLPPRPLTDSSSLFLPLGLILLFLLSYSLHRWKYGRDFTYGRVEGVRGGKVLVRVGYDLRSNVKPGLYLVESLVTVRKGERVKVGVERGLLGMRGSVPRVVMGRERA